MSIEGTAQTEYASLSGKIHTIVIDKSLSISGACADAKATGDAVEKVESQIDWAIKSAEEAEAAYKQAVEDMDELATEAAQKAVDALSAHELNAYEKEEVLSADTKAKYGLGEEAKPDDAFNGLYVPVGTVRQSIRTDLGDSWALCNGDAFSASEYPELASFATPSNGTQGDGSFGSTVGDVFCYNGTWVVLGSYPNIFVSNDPTSAGWTTVTIDTETYRNIYGVTCYDGTWVIVGSKYDSDSNDYPYIYTATDPFGVWTGLQIATEKGIMRDIACYNGEWIAVGQDDASSNTSGWIYKSASANPSGAWLGTKISNTPFYKVACHNGTWVALGTYSSNKYPKVFNLDSNGTWNGQELKSVTVEVVSSIALMGLACHDGTWVACVSTSGSPYTAYAFVTDDPAGAWTEYTLYSTDANSYRPHVQDLTFVDGKWMCAGYKNTSSGNSQRPCVYIATDPAGTWERHDLNNDLQSKLPCIFSYDGTTIAISDANHFYHFGYYNLPVINTEGTHTYIKVKDGA